MVNLDLRKKLLNITKEFLSLRLLKLRLNYFQLLSIFKLKFE
jgi:hypothetical protein